MKKILVVDDSALMRKQIRQILESTNYQVEVARNGQEGLDKIQKFKPDAVTLDINMPVMDGLTCLSHIMTDMPTPVVMVSSLTDKGALATFEALEMGAIDYVAKPGGTVSLNITDIEAELLTKIKAALRSRLGKTRGLRQRLKEQHKNQAEKSKAISKRPIRKVVKTKKSKEGGIVVIGVSTGGPGTLEHIIQGLPADFPWPIVVAQHMPANFTKVFAERLNKICDIEVLELNKTSDLIPGQVLIGRGDADVKLIQRKDHVLATSIPMRKEYVWHPSVAYMVQSVGEFYEEHSIICVQLTGMGDDGAQEMNDLHNKGARTIAESEESSVVYGMPKALIDLGGADKVLDYQDVAQQLVDWVYE